MKSKLLVLPILLLICCTGQLFAQRRTVNYTEIGGLLNWNNSAGDNSSFNAIRVRTGITRIVTPYLGLGIALGTDNFRRNTGEAYTALPLTANASFFAKEDLTGFKVDVYGGYSIGVFNNFYSGLAGGAGISYSIELTKTMNIGLQTGYNYQEINLPARFLQDKLTVGSLRLGIGLTFK